METPEYDLAVELCRIAGLFARMAVAVAAGDYCGAKECTLAARASIVAIADDLERFEAHSGVH